MKITVHVRPDVARALREDVHESEAERLRAVVREVGATLEPVHPGTTDAELARSFTLDVPDLELAARVAERLRALPSVEAAYVKPADALPAPHHPHG